MAGTTWHFETANRASGMQRAGNRIKKGLDCRFLKRNEWDAYADLRWKMTSFAIEVRQWSSFENRRRG